jgi:hypothetical protein
MGSRTTARHEIAGIHADAQAEALLVKQFRFWMSGHATREFGYVTKAWAALSGTVSSNSAKLIFAEIHIFTRILYDHSVRRIEWLPDLGRCISYDEGLILALVQASQNNEPLTEIAAASELLGTFDVESLIQASRSLGEVLSMNNLVLEPIECVTQCNAADIGVTSRILH